MSSGTQQARILRFGSYEADLVAGELLRNGIRIRLEAQPFRLLAMLLQRPGEVVTREDIQQSLWPDTPFVDFDNGLNTAIRKIRRALNDSASHPRYIETLPRKGYRFLAPVSGSPAPSLRGRRVRSRAVLWSLVSVATIAAVLAGWAVYRHGEPGRAPAGLVPELVPLTTYPGNEYSPSFSPDGNRVAFVWTGPNDNNYDIYVKLIGSDNPQRRTSHPARDFSPAFSPDGRWIAFVRETSRPDRYLEAGFRMEGGRGDVMLAPSVGGPERKVAEIPLILRGGFRATSPVLTWLDQGEHLAVVDRPSADEPAAVYSLSIATRQKRRLSSPPAGTDGDFGPAFSSSTRTLAFFRPTKSREVEVLTLRLSEDLLPEGPEVRRGESRQWLSSPAWSADGRELILAAGELAPGLFRVPIQGSGAVRRLGYVGQVPRFPAISPDGMRLAYSSVSGWAVDIWELNLNRLDAAPLITSTRLDSNARYSPDGTRIAFQSMRSGTREIWLSDGDGQNPRQLTFLKAYFTSDPVWSPPDGTRIAFHSDRRGNLDIYQIDPLGGEPTRLTHNPARDRWAVWSRDGRWIYFESDRGGHAGIWKVRADGGEPVLVLPDVSGPIHPSIDGRVLYFTDNGVPASIWASPAGGGEAVEVLHESVSHPGHYSVAADGIYFIPPAEPPAASSIKFHSFASGEVTHVADLPKAPHWGLDVSPDGQSILFTQREDIGADLMLVENFR